MEGGGKAPEIKPIRTAAGLHAELPPIDPLDPAQLEQFMLERSGLLKVRPPLPAAQSGDNFYHAIPFQVGFLAVPLQGGPLMGVMGYDKGKTAACMAKFIQTGSLPSCPADSHDGRCVQILSWAPRVVVFPAFVDKARCDHIIAMASKLIFPSGLAYAPGDKAVAEQQTRTSKGTFLSEQMDHAGVLAWIEERIAAVTLLPRENGEVGTVLLTVQ